MRHSPREAARSGASRVAALVQRRPVLSVLVVAFAARLVVAVAVYVTRGGIGFQDDATYWTMASQAARGATSRWDAYTHWLYDYTATFLVPLTYVYKLSDGVRLAGQLFSAVCGALTAGLVTRLALEVTGRRVALVAGLVVALLPSQVLWSSLTFKDATVWLVVAASAVVVALLTREGQRARLVGLLALATFQLFLLDHLRVATFVIAAWAFAMAAWFGPSPRRALRGVAATGVALILPWALGVGVAGIAYIQNGGASLQTRRVNNAIGAATAVVPTQTATPRSTSSARPGEGGGTHPGQLQASPSATSAAEPPPSLNDSASEQFATNLHYLPHGLAVILVRPWPWAGSSNGSVTAARLENVVWWPLLALAGAGLVAVRRHAGVLVYPLLVGAATAGTYALAEGNFGTAYRHRGELVWIVALFAALGCRLVYRCVTERRRAGSGGPASRDSHDDQPATESSITR